MKLTKSQVTDEMKEALFAWWDAEIEADTYFLAEGCANRELENISYELYVKLVALLNGHSYYVAQLINWFGLKSDENGFAIPRKEMK